LNNIAGLNNKFILVLYFSTLVLSPITSLAFNEKKLCLFHAQHYQLGTSNRFYINAEKTLAIRKTRKIDVLNTSEYTYLSAGGIAHFSRGKVYLGLSTNLQLGAAKFRHFWPTVRYTYLLNESEAPHRVCIGLSYLPFKNCGINYSYTLNNNNHKVYNIEHQFGLVFNLRHKKLICLEKRDKN